MYLDSKENKVYTVTYADDGGGNKYYIDGVKQATLTGLIRGATYTFDTVSNREHNTPIQIICYISTWNRMVLMV